jgi:hypothetical protein
MSEVDEVQALKAKLAEAEARAKAAEKAAIEACGFDDEARASEMSLPASTASLRYCGVGMRARLSRR